MYSYAQKLYQRKAAALLKQQSKLLAFELGKLSESTFIYNIKSQWSACRRREPQTNSVGHVKFPNTFLLDETKGNLYIGKIILVNGIFFYQFRFISSVLKGVRYRFQFRAIFVFIFTFLIFSL